MDTPPDITQEGGTQRVLWFVLDAHGVLLSNTAAPSQVDALERYRDAYPDDDRAGVRAEYVILPYEVK